MKYILIIMSLAMVACGQPSKNNPLVNPLKEKKYTIKMLNGNGYTTETWKTDWKPLVEGGGWLIILDNGEKVRISGTIVITESK